jgi:hypothetical protein
MRITTWSVCTSVMTASRFLQLARIVFDLDAVVDLGDEM